jgi:glutamine amidotransferase PdxT
MIEKVGATVEVLARMDAEPILVRQGLIMASSFHPELVEDGRIHQMFVDLVRQHQQELTSLQSTHGMTAKDDLLPSSH